jgi:hypothetical protein
MAAKKRKRKWNVQVGDATLDQGEAVDMGDTVPFGTMPPAGNRNWRVRTGSAQLEPAVNVEIGEPQLRTVLDDTEEGAFQSDMQSGDGYRQWRQEFERLYGGAPDYDDPHGDYDYRAAWKGGIRPEVYKHDGTYHWSSSLPDGQMLKSENHPTAWMEHFMRATGVDPNELGIRDADDAKRYLSGDDSRLKVEIGDPVITESGSAPKRKPKKPVRR